jgi:hypothetical protein
LETTLAVLREGRPCTTVYETTFLIQWPEPLGGGSVKVDLDGSMGLIPLMGTT